VKRKPEKNQSCQDDLLVVYQFLSSKVKVQIPARLNFFRLFFASAEVATLTAMIFFTLCYFFIPQFQHSVEPRVNLQTVFSYNPCSSHPSKRLANNDVVERIFSGAYNFVYRFAASPLA